MGSQTVRRRMTAEQRRARILDAAVDVFAERGYAGASMGDIASRAGVVASVIYDHFTSKRELHGLLIETLADDLLGRTGASVTLDASQEERLRASFDAFFGFVEERFAQARVLFLDPVEDPAAKEDNRRVQQRATLTIAGFLAAAEPSFMAGDTAREQVLEIYAEFMKSGLNALAGWWHDHPDVARADIVERAMDVCWHGLATMAKRP